MVAYIWPGRGARISDRKNRSGGGQDWPRRGSSFCSGASQGVCAVEVFVVVLFWGFNWPRRQAQLRGGVWGGVCINMVWGFECVVVDMVFISAHGGG
jgi:hypothetical protein